MKFTTISAIFAIAGAASAVSCEGAKEIVEGKYTGKLSHKIVADAHAKYNECWGQDSLFKNPFEAQEQQAQPKQQQAPAGNQPQPKQQQAPAGNQPQPKQQQAPANHQSQPKQKADTPQEKGAPAGGKAPHESPEERRKAAAQE